MTEAVAPAFPARTTFLDRLAKRPFATLFLLCFIAWVPGFFTLPPLDRDESRFAQASKQMIETGNYVDIRYSVGPRYKKPVGIYWLQAASTKLFSEPPYNEIWTYRLPSLIGGFVAVFLAFWCARAFASPPVALIAAALDRLHRGAHRRNQDRQDRCGAAGDGAGFAGVADAILSRRARSQHARRPACGWRWADGSRSRSASCSRDRSSWRCWR